ncbi:Uncharacterized protein APZ42_006639 [Daphnia magna]|uniref:Uncharacterized protein n=1 Tax=Daphnia magna TaxID=35525 RepID=A0A164FS91_9CRUS|nr:Uncharacterized protein APZ42_006639 [Daphnia magna]
MEPRFSPDCLFPGRGGPVNPIMANRGRSLITSNIF